jgi:hypothetical protein
VTHAVSRAAPRRAARPALDARHAAPTSPVPELLRTAWTTWFPYAVIGLGVLARLRQWAGGRSLWLDEVLIADNLVHRGFWQLLTDQLAHSQAAPVLWLWTERLMVDVFGSSERSLRILPLLSGIAVLWLTLLLARQVLPRVLVPVPVLLVSLHPGLIYYANEVKQYSTDVMVVLVLLLLAFRIPSRTVDGPALRRFSAVAVVAVWASHPSVFVLAALSLVLVLRPTIAGDTARAFRVALVLSPWLLSLLVSYVLVLRKTTENDALFAYWGYSFPRGTLDLPAWFCRRWYGLAHLPLQLTVRPIGLALLAFGLFRLCKHGGRSASLLWAAVPVALLGAAVSAYPFAGRLALWLVPIAAITMTAAIPHRFVQRRAAWLLAATTALTLVSAPALAGGLQRTVQVQEVEELRPLLQRFSEVRKPGDLVLVEVATREAFEYYAEQTGVSRDGVILFTVRPGYGPCDDLPALNAGRFATDRVWVISSHRLVDTARLGTLDDMLGRIRTVTREIDHLHDTRADAWLFDPSTGAQTLTQVGPRNPERCLAVVRSAR